MNEDVRTATLLTAYLETLPNVAPGRILDRTLITVAKTRQAQSWLPAVVGRRTEWRPSRAAVMGLGAVGGLAILVAIALVFVRVPPNLAPATAPVVASPSPDASPTRAATATPATTSTQTTNFSRPFTFDARGTDARVWLDMPNVFDLVSPSRPGLHANESLVPYPSDSKGLIVMSTALGGADYCPHRFLQTLSLAPGDDVMAVLHGEAGMTFVTNPASVVDTVAGRPAVEASVIASCNDGLFVRGSTSETVQLARPNSRLFVVPLVDTTLMIQVWAQSADELQGWLPRALTIMESMELLNDDTAPSKAVSSSNFELPFTYILPAGFSPLTTHDWTDMVWLITRSSTAVLGESWPANQELYPPDSNGLAIASTKHSSVYPCPQVGIGAVPISPQGDVVSQLRETAGLVFETTPTTIDGHAASVTTEVHTSPPCGDGLVIHLADGSTGATVSMATYREKIYFLPIGDTTLVLQIWSGGPDADQWVEQADQIVETLRFADQ